MTRQAARLPEPPVASPVPDGTFREAMARIAMPVAVVTTRGPTGEARAFTVTSFCSLSADPPLLLVCVNRGSRAHDPVVTAARFVVNVLSADQGRLAGDFARHDRAVAEAALTAVEDGLPGLPGAAVRLICDRHEVLPGGDHSILIGMPTRVVLSDAPPLVHYRRSWHRPATL